jgi:hypothetical protein
MALSLIRATSSVVVALSFVAIGAGGCSSCSTNNGVTPSSDAGFLDTKADAEPDQNAERSESGPDANSEDSSAQDAGTIEVGPWDPEWHKTTPANWPEVPKGQRPDCGAHCRVIATSLPDTLLYRAPRTSDRWVIVQGRPSGTLEDKPIAIAVDLAADGGPREFIVDDVAWITESWGARAPIP